MDLTKVATSSGLDVVELQGECATSRARPLLLDCFEGHLPRGTSGSLFPFREQRSVVFGDVIFVTRPEFLRRSIDPPRLSFDFAKIPDRRFIHHYVAFAITPLRAEFFIAEGWRIAQGLQDLVHRSEERRVGKECRCGR